MVSLLFSKSIFAQCIPQIGIDGSSSASACSPNVISFIDQSVIGSGWVVSSRKWNFGDTTSTTNNPIHSFSAGKNSDLSVTVTLTITCTDGTNTLKPQAATFPIISYHHPAVSFDFPATPVCQLQDPVVFNNTSENLAGYTYAWKFGDTKGVSQNYSPTYVYSSPGLWTPTLTVTSDHNCSSDSKTTKQVNVIARPNPTFDHVVPTNACNPISVNVTNTTDPTEAVTWIWSWGDGTLNDTIKDIALTPTRNHFYANFGTNTINYIARNSFGCQNNNTYTFIIKETPKVKIKAPKDVCLESPATIYDSIVNKPATVYSWDFSSPNSTIGSGSGPYDVDWIKAGSKRILIATNLNGCITKDSTYLFVKPQPIVYLSAVTTADTNGICQGEEVTFQANPGNYSEYIFTIFDSGGTPLFSQTSSSSKFTTKNLMPGNKVYVDAVDYNGCPSKIIGGFNTVKVHPAPIVDLIVQGGKKDTICSGDTIKFSVNSTPLNLTKYVFYNGFDSIQWGTKSTLVFTQPLEGRPIRVMGYDTKCPSDTSNPQSYYLPKAIFDKLQAPNVFCGQSSASSAEFLWDPIDGADSYMVSVNGGPLKAPNGLWENNVTGLTLGSAVTLSVQAFGKGPCGGGIMSSSNFKCFADPCTGFNFSLIPKTNTPICEGESVTAQICGINSIATNKPLKNYNVFWNNSLIPTQQLTYNQTPAKTDTIFVTVKNTDEPTCPSVTKSTIINVTPTPNVTITSAYTNDTVCQNISKIKFIASPALYDSYDFYDEYNLVQSGSNPNYITNNINSGHRISVSATNKGCVANSKDSIRVYTSNTLTVPQVNCYKTTKDSVIFAWDPVVNAKNYEINIDATGFFNLNKNLQYKIGGLSSGDSKMVIVRAMGNAPCGLSSYSQPTTCYTLSCVPITFDIIPNQVVCENTPLTLSLNNLNIPNYSISWNNGSLTAAKQFTFTPKNDTTINVKVWNNAQPACPAAVKYFFIRVVQIPLALNSSVSNDSVCGNTPISFYATPGGYDNYQFYDNFKLAQSSKKQVYTTDTLRAGHAVKVIITNAGCSKTVGPIPVKPYQVIKALAPPQANCGTTDSTISFVWDSVVGAKGYQILLNNACDYVSVGKSLSYKFQPTDTNINTIIVKAMGINPCGDSPISIVWKKDTTKCSAKPCSKINFNRPSDVQACAGTTVNLKATGITAKNHELTWSGSFSLLDSTFNYVPSKTDTIQIILKDLDQPTCPVIKKYTIVNYVPIPTATIVPNPLNDSICAKSQITITASPAGWDKYEFKSKGKVLFDSLGYHVFKTSKLFKDTLISVKTTYKGCTFTSDSLDVKVIDAPAITLTSDAKPDGVCESLSITFSVSPKAYTKYFFYNLLNKVQDSVINSYTINNIKLIDTVKIVGISANAQNFFGCMSNTSSTIKTVVKPQTNISLTTLPKDSVCDKTPMLLSATITTANALPVISYNFYDKATLLQSGLKNSYTTSSLSIDNKITAIAVNNKNCNSNALDTIHIKVIPLSQPKITVSDTAVCNGNAVKLNAAVGSGYFNVKYIWSFDTSKHIANVSYTPKVTGFIKVISSNSGCIANRDSILIVVDKIMPTPAIVISKGKSKICEGDTVHLLATGGTTYQWYPSKGLDFDNIPNPVASPKENTVYQVIAKNIACEASAQVPIDIDLCLKELDKNTPIPKIITPNNDGANDYWIVPNITYFESNTVSIYNRWGNLVFEAKHYNNDWYGLSSGGKPLPDGTYYYVINLGNGLKSYSGYVMIER